MTEDFSDLDFYGSDFEPKHPGFGQDVLTLPPGIYDCEILEAEFKMTSNGKRICGWDVRVNEGVIMQQTYWLDGEYAQQAINSLGADLCVLGIDCRGWGKSGYPPLSQAIPAAVGKLRGIRFRATRYDEENKKDPGKPYRKFRIITRIGGNVSNTALPQPAAMPTSQPQQAASANDNW